MKNLIALALFMTLTNFANAAQYVALDLAGSSKLLVNIQGAVAQLDSEKVGKFDQSPCRDVLKNTRTQVHVNTKGKQPLFVISLTSLNSLDIVQKIFITTDKTHMKIERMDYSSDLESSGHQEDNNAREPVVQEFELADNDQLVTCI